MRGINNFADYESCYAVNSYYIATETLNQQIHESEPEHLRASLKIVAGKDRIRRVVVDSHADPGWFDLGTTYLRKLEVDPIIQAAGRVRFMTKPREIVFFSLHDISRDIGPVEEVPNLTALLSAFGAPSPKELDRYVELDLQPERLRKRVGCKRD